MGKFSCLGIPAALFLLAADVSSAKPNKIALRSPVKPRSRGRRAWTGSPQLSIREGGQTSSERGKWFEKLLKCLLIVGCFFLLVLSLVGVGMLVHKYTNTPPTDACVKLPNIGPTDSDILSNPHFPIAPTTTSATGRDGRSGAYLDSAVEQQERKKHAGFIATAKKEFLKQCILKWSPLDGVDEESREAFHDALNWNIQLYGNRAVESPEELIDGWVTAGSEALEEFNKEQDECIKKHKRNLIELLGNNGFNQGFKDQIIDWDEVMRGRIQYWLKLPYARAHALSYVAEEIRRELSDRSVRVDIELTRIDGLLRKKVKEPTEIELCEEKLLREVQELLVVLKKGEVTNGKIRLPESNVDRINDSMMKLTKLEEKYAGFIVTAKKEFLKLCILFWSPVDGIAEESREAFHDLLNRAIQPYGNRAVESPEELIDGWVTAGSEALEEFNKEKDQLMDKHKRNLIEFLGKNGFNQGFKDQIIDWDEDTRRKITIFLKLPYARAHALSYVAEQIRRELSDRSVRGIKKLLREKVRKPTYGKGERRIELCEGKLLWEVQQLLVVLKKGEVTNGKIKLPKSNVDRIKKSMMKLTKLEKQKQQEKKNN